MKNAIIVIIVGFAAWFLLKPKKTVTGHPEQPQLKSESILGSWFSGVIPSILTGEAPPVATAPGVPSNVTSPTGRRTTGTTNSGSRTVSTGTSSGSRPTSSGTSSGGRTFRTIPPSPSAFSISSNPKIPFV